MATFADLVKNFREAYKIDVDLFNASRKSESTAQGWPHFYSEMTQDEMDALYAWDRTWIEDKSVREMYMKLIALENL